MSYKEQRPEGELSSGKECATEKKKGQKSGGRLEMWVFVMGFFIWEPRCPMIGCSQEKISRYCGGRCNNMRTSSISRLYYMEKLTAELEVILHFSLTIEKKKKGQTPV